MAEERAMNLTMLFIVDMTILSPTPRRGAPEAGR